MIRKILIITALVFSLFNYSFGQAVLSGYLRNSLDGEFIIGGSILVTPIPIDTSKEASILGTVSNEFGFYSITLPRGQYRIDYSYIGFQTLSKTLNIDKNLTLDVELLEGGLELETVVVTSAQERANTTEIGVEKLKVTTIEKLPAILGEPDVLKSIQLLPGVSSANEASSGFNVRGGSADQNLILLDEGTIYNASHLFGLFSVFNTDAINNVTLYKGGIPASFGGRLSSVLDIQQREGNRKKFGGKASIGLIASKLLLEGPLVKKEKETAKGSYLFAARRSYADLFTVFIPEVRGNKLFFYDLNMKVNYELNSRNKLFLSGYFGRDNFKLPGLVGTSWGNISGTLRWTSLISEKLFFQTSAIFSNYDYNLDILRSGSELRWTSSIRNLNLKPSLNWYINPKNTLKFGVEVLDYTFKPAEISPLLNSPIVPETFQPKYALEGGAYIDYQQTINDQLQFRYGIRLSSFWRMGSSILDEYVSGTPLSYNEQTGAYFENPSSGQTNYNKREVIEHYYGLEPRFSVNYQINEGQSLKFGYNRMFQYIHLISNTASPTPLDVWTPSGKYIEPQRSDQFSIGYVKNNLFNQFDLTVETFYKDLQNTTNFRDGADLLFTENIEREVIQGSGKAYGLEVLLEKKKGNFTGWLSYTLARSEQKILGVNNNEVFPSNYDQTHELNIVGMYQLSPKWELSGNWIFGSGRPVTYPSGRYNQNGLVVADYSNRNADRLPAYHRLDVAVIYRPNPTSKREGTWTFSIANVYNRLNASSIFFREVSSVNGIEQATGIGEAVQLSYYGIVPSVSYKFSFGK